jgi:hypothetical protein
MGPSSVTEILQAQKEDFKGVRAAAAVGRNLRLELS